MLIRQALRIALGYTVFGILWIISSDYLVHLIDPSLEGARVVQTIKGIAFVLVSGLLVLSLALRELVLQRRYRQKLDSIEAQLRQVVENTSDLVYSYRFVPQRGFTYVSPSCLPITGYSQAEHYKDPDLSYKIVHPDDRHLLENASKPENLAKPLTLRWIRKDGKVIFVQHKNFALRDEAGNLVGISGVGRDVTETELARLELERLNSAYAVLWQTNRLIVRSQSIVDIYREICEISLSTGKFTLVWVGEVREAENRLVPAFVSGEKASYIDKVTITLDDTPTGRGPSGLAARTGKIYASSDIGIDPFMLPWREKALAHGFRSSAALPLIVKGNVVAVWNLYSPLPDYFNERVLNLYGELANDISFAISVKRAEEERKELALKLDTANRRWQFATESTGFGLWDWNVETNEVYFSESLAAMLGYTLEEWGSDLSSWEKRIHPEDADRVHQNLEAHFRGETEIYSCEHRLLCKDGSYRWIMDRGKVIEWTADRRPKRMIGLHRDITQEIEKRLEAYEREESYATLISQSPLGIAIISTVTGKIYSVNPSFCRILGRSEAELTTTTWQAFTHPEDIAPNEELNAQILRGERSEYAIEKRYLRPDGTILWARLTVKKLEHYRKEQNVHLALVEDITERVQNENRLRLDAAVISHTRDGVVVTDLTPRIISVNQAYTEITGYTAEEVIGRNPNILRSGKQDVHFYRAMWKEILETGRWQGELYNRRKNGEIYPQLSTIDTIYDAEGKPQYYVGVFSDITKLKKSEERFERLAHYDILTGLPNRLMVTSRLVHAIESAARHERQIAVLFMDLDHFKNINDSLGHLAGDELLAEVSERLKARIRSEDTIARLGGDEFLIILEDLESPEHAALVARDLLANLASPFLLSSGHEVYTGGSIGISIYPQDGDNAADLIRNADAAMYLSKSEGRSTFRFYRNSLTEAARKRLELEAALRRAIENQELYVAYQPIVEMSTGLVCGAEALCRWRTAEGKEIAPIDFIPVAEETGLIVAIGDFVLRTALAQAKLWLKNPQFRTIAVNFSVRQFQKPDWHERFTAILRESGVPAEHVEIEITESDIMQQSEEGVEVIRKLHSAGVKIAIDDFGTGYSSLSYLQRFSVNTLKIDQSFVRELPQSHATMQLVRTMITLARNLNLSSLAEGVETLEQMQFLKAEGCHHYQGYLKSKPVDAIEFTRRFLS